MMFVEDVVGMIERVEASNNLSHIHIAYLMFELHTRHCQPIELTRSGCRRKISTRLRLVDDRTVGSRKCKALHLLRRFA